MGCEYSQVENTHYVPQPQGNNDLFIDSDDLNDLMLQGRHSREIRPAPLRAGTGYLHKRYFYELGLLLLVERQASDAIYS